MEKKGNRGGKSDRPMQNRRRGEPFLVSEVVEKIAAQDEEGGYTEHDAAGPAPAHAAPASGDVHAPQQSNEPQGGETKSAVSCDRPELKRMGIRPERSFQNEEVVRE